MMQEHPATTTRVWRVLLAALAFGGLTSTLGAAPRAAAAEPGSTIAVTGTLTDEGVTCRAMRGDDGVLYKFGRTATIRSFRTGDRIKIEGKVTAVSICQQGTTVVVTHAEKAE